MPQPNDLSRSTAAFVQDSTLVAVIELSLSSWLVAGVVPGIDRQPLKKLEPDEAALLRLLQRWRDEAAKSGCIIDRITVGYEAGRDGFWLARWLEGHGIETHVIHSSSVAVSREHRRAKTDRLDTAMLLRVFMGWMRGERGHCGMVAVPTIGEEDAKRPHRERENLVGEDPDHQSDESGADPFGDPGFQSRSCGAHPRSWTVCPRRRVCRSLRTRRISDVLNSNQRRTAA